MDNNASVNDPKPVLPLNFPPTAAASPPVGVDGPCGPVQCMFECDNVFEFPAQKDECLAHLYVQHNMIISDVADVALLPEYLLFWRKKFEAVHFDAKEFCTTLLLNHLPDRTPAPPTEYFLLDDNLPLDRAQRLHLRQRRLETVLARHQLERTDHTYSRTCFLCRTVCTPTRPAVIEHLFRKHALHLGRPDNLVYIDELLDDVCDRLERLVCLFCARTFKDRPTLKEHMRKKGHRRINPDDQLYDKFYMVNYTREPAASAPSSTSAAAANAAQEAAERGALDAESRLFQRKSEDSDSDWSDWEGDAESTMRCLFCAHTAAKYTLLSEHIHTAHAVDLNAQLAPLSFHKKVKLVNYVRHRMHANTCVTCELVCTDAAALSDHLTAASHYGTGGPAQWDRPNFLFPLFEDDPLLFCLDDAPESWTSGSSTRSGCESPVNMADGVEIYAEEIRCEVNEDAEALSKALMIKL